MSDSILSQEMLDTLLPASRSDEFFEALYGDADEGAYDIKLVFRNKDENTVNLAFELHQRPEKCLVCSVTYGLPQVFKRHPLINTANIAKEVAKALGWDADACSWDLGPTKENSAQLHCIDLIIKK